MKVTSDPELIENVREAVRGVTKRFGRDYYLQRARDHAHVPELWACMAEQGLFALGIPEEYGGLGGGVTAQVAAMEALAEHGIPPVLYTTTVFTRTLILAAGTEAQRKEFIPAVVSGEKKFAFAMTEPNAGTNTFGMSTRAERVNEDTYRLNGQKVYITGIDEAELLMVVAQSKLDDGSEDLSVFIIELPAERISYEPMDMVTFAPGRQFIVHFDDVEVPAANRVGGEGEAKKVLFHGLNPERFMTTAQSIGFGQLALVKGAEYAKVRAPFGVPIGSYQGVQHPLANAKAHLEAARLMLYAACSDYENGINDGRRANMAKYLASCAADLAIDAAIQAHGASAFDVDSDLVTLWPKIRLSRIAPINNEMALNFIGEKLLGLPRSY
jgi:alkylation response protein AidB-like acyl-CoA dehydrogenase